MHEIFSIVFVFDYNLSRPFRFIIAFTRFILILTLSAFFCQVYLFNKIKAFERILDNSIDPCDVWYFLIRFEEFEIFVCRQLLLQGCGFASYNSGTNRLHLSFLLDIGRVYMFLYVASH